MCVCVCVCVCVYNLHTQLLCVCVCVCVCNLHTQLHLKILKKNDATSHLTPLLF